MDKLDLSLVIITLNEEDVIERCIKSVPFASQIVVVDSGSCDNTLQIAKSLGADVFYKEWQGFAAQKYYANQQANYEWILSLDADEWLSKELAEEIYKKLSQINTDDVYSMKRLSRYLGKWIYYGGWFPDIQKRLFKKSFAEWKPSEQIHEKIFISQDAKQSILDGLIFHEPFSSIHEQCNINFKYAELLAESKFKKGKRLNNSFFIVVKTLFKFMENYIFKKGFLDGIPGFIIAWNSAQSYMVQNYIIYKKTRG